MDYGLAIWVITLGVIAALAIGAGITFARTRSWWSFLLLVGVVAWFVAMLTQQWLAASLIFYIGLVASIIWALAPPKGRRMFAVAFVLWVACTLLLAPVELLRSIRVGETHSNVGILLVMILAGVSLLIGLINWVIGLFRRPGVTAPVKLDSR